jgi:hypothetical protein
LIHDLEDRNCDQFPRINKLSTFFRTPVEPDEKIAGITGPFVSRSRLKIEVGLFPKSEPQVSWCVPAPVIAGCLSSWTSADGRLFPRCSILNTPPQSGNDLRGWEFLIRVYGRPLDTFPRPQRPPNAGAVFMLRCRTFGEFGKLGRPYSGSQSKVAI